MSKIYLAKKSKRIFARLVDVLILFVLTLGTFFALTPLTFDSKTYNENVNSSLIYYENSGLYLKKKNQKVSGKISHSHLPYPEPQ